MVDALIKGFAISLLLIFSVGPVIFTIIKQSINNGRAGGFSFVFGVWLSDLLWVMLSNGFSELVAQLLHFEKEIGIAGSIFLICLGIYYVFFKKIHMSEDENKINITSATHTKLFISGFIINTLNPAVIGFWLTSATAIAASHSVKQRIVIFSTCILLNASADVAKVLLAGKLRSKLNDKVLSLVNKFSGLIMLGFGIALLLGVLYDSVKK